MGIRCKPCHWPRWLPALILIGVGNAVVAATSAPESVMQPGWSASHWDQHRMELILVLLAMAMLSVLVLGLLHLNRRLARAKAEVVALNREQASYARKRQCLYRISRVGMEAQRSLNEILSLSVNLIPSCCLQPEMLCARIVLDDEFYATENYRETPWRLSADIAISARKLGVLEVFYLGQERVDFLQEEGPMLDELARNLAATIEYKRAEEALQRSEARLKVAQRIGCIGDWELNLSTNTLLWSEEIFRLFEIDPANFGATYEAFLERVHPDDRETVNASYLHSLASRTPYSLSHRLLMQDGRVKYVHEQCESEFDANGRAVISRGTVQDITERRYTDENQRIAVVAFESQESMMVTNVEGAILRVNKAFTKDTGYSAEEVQGLTPRLLKSGRHNAEFYRDMWNTIRRTGTWQGEIWDRHKDGEIRPKFLTIAAVKNTQGLVTHYVGSYLDITERKAAEEEMLKARKMMQRGLLIREVHHRIKNNLQGITGILRLKASTHPELAEAIHQVIGQVNSVAMIHGLQGSSGMSEVRLCELTAAIAAESGKLWNTAIELDIPLDWIPYKIAETEAVPVALVLNELIANALKHGHDKKVSISIRNGLRPESVLLTIKNPGLIPQDFGIANAASFGTGLQLVASLLPQDGVELYWRQQVGSVTTNLEIFAPVIELDDKELCAQ